MSSKVKSAFGGKKIGVLVAIVVATLAVSSFVVISLVAGEAPGFCGDGFCDKSWGENSVNCPGDCYCGNGSVDPGEQCDDGNTIGGDGCSAECMFEWEIDDDPDPRDRICDSGCVDVDYPNCGPGSCIPRWNNMWRLTCRYYKKDQAGCGRIDFCYWTEPGEDPPYCELKESEPGKSIIDCWNWDYDKQVCNAQPYCTWDDGVCVDDRNLGCSILAEEDCGLGSDACYWDGSECKYVGDDAIRSCLDYDFPTCEGYNYCDWPLGCDINLHFIYFCNAQTTEESCVATGEHCRWDDDVEWCFVDEEKKRSCLRDPQSDDIDLCLKKPYCQWYVAYGSECLFCEAAEPDSCPPGVTMTDGDPNPVPVDTPILLTANVDDSRTGGSVIDSAEYNIDGGEWLAMSARDGDFDGVSEDVEALIPAFPEPGVHEVCVSGTDAEGNIGLEECIFLVVYDPEGGFVSGGGWIHSPAGAYTSDPSLTGKAIFGFVSKYKKGATIPTGQTEFQFKVADLNFHSTSYDWLVVNQGGNNAQFKGWGTINGGSAPSGNDYRFMLWAGDDEPDTLRIKIWWEYGDIEQVVYDNGFNQAIGGGNIVVHKK